MLINGAPKARQGPFCHVGPPPNVQPATAPGRVETWRLLDAIGRQQTKGGKQTAVTHGEIPLKCLTHLADTPSLASRL